MKLFHAIPLIIILSFIVLHARANQQLFQSYVFSGNEYFRNNQLDEAVQAYFRALTYQPNSTPVLFNLGLVYIGQNNMKQAMQNFKIVVHQAPDHIKAHLNLARIYQQEKQSAHALYHYQQAAHYNPDDVEPYLEASKIYQELGLYEQSLEQLTRAVTCPQLDNAQKSALAKELLVTGNAFFNQRKTDKALTTFRLACKLSDRFAAIYHNIAFTLAEQTGKHHEAIVEYKKALAIKPQDYETLFCYAMSLLAIGNVSDGFVEYEARWRRPLAVQNKITYPFDRQLTNIYEQDINHKRVLLRVEQGLGDTLQFVRYAQLLKKRGAHIIVEAQKPLIKLLSLCDYIDELVVYGSKRPPFDYQIPMLNLPQACKTTLETIPAPIPYITAKPDLVTYWKEKLSRDHTFKVGICWFGDAVHGQVKFMPLSYFARLAQLNGITLYSLQKGNGVEQLEKEICIQQLGPDFDESHGSFMDTAAVMKNLDLIITVDTSVAHLAGALGVPVWVILPFPAEWRWLMNRNDCPWYPTMRLFRQTGPENWDNVLAELFDALVPLLER